MAYWQFLIQKAGDRAWLPLDPSGEILEGRYRVAVRTNQTNANVSIQISHQFEQHGGPQQHLSQQSQVSDAEGLVVVVPFTYLQPGLWTLTCSSSSLSDSTSHAWQDDSQHRVQLQVLPNLAAYSDWDGFDSSNLVDLQTPDSTELETASLDTSGSEQEIPLPNGTKPANPISPAPALISKQKATVLDLPTFSGHRAAVFKLSAGQVFPPQICNLTSQAGRRTPELPVIPSAKVDPSRSEVTSARLASSKRIRSNPSHSAPSPREQAAKIGETFEALNLKNRFWSTLNALATESESTGQPESALEPKLEPAAALDPGLDDNSVPASQAAQSDLANSQVQAGETELDSRTVSLPNPNFRQQRLVNLQGLLLRPENQLRLQRAIAKTHSESTAPRPLSLSVKPKSARNSDSLLPPPSLFVPPAALIAGQPVVVRVRLPEQPASIYVKFWVSDGQTNALLDGPRWLVDFVVNQTQGLLETSTRLTIPLASVEVSFKAIAINVQTQQESQSVTVKRSVLADHP